MNSKEDFWGFMDTYALLLLPSSSGTNALVYFASTFLDTFYPEKPSSFWLLGNSVSRGSTSFTAAPYRFTLLILLLPLRPSQMALSQNKLASSVDLDFVKSELG